MARIVVAEPVASEGLALLREAGHELLDLSGASATEHEGDVGTEAATHHRGGAEVGEGMVGIGQQDLGRIAATERNLRFAMAGEIERPHWPAPRFGPRWHSVR